MYNIHLTENMKVEAVILYYIFTGVNELTVKIHIVTIYIIINNIDVIIL